MSEIRKILAQSFPAATILTDVYTVSAVTQSVISTLTACNQGPTGTDFRVSVANAGEANSAKQYLYYDVYIDPYDTFATTIGITLNTNDVIRCYSTSGTVSFVIFGVEIT